MSSVDLAVRTRDLRAQRRPFVLATVVRVECPTSAKPGDAAVLLPDGTLEGFVGGSCAESTVRSHGLRSLRTGESTLLRVTPGPAAEEDAAGIVTVANPCLSGGTMDVFLEVMSPPTLVHVFGDTPIALALDRIATDLGYAVTATSDPDVPVEPDTSALVVASHGRCEEVVLTAGLRAGVRHVALVASRRRGAAVLASLDVDDAERARVRTPAGLDIGARTAPEIALSILADVVATRPRVETGSLPEDAEDPMCGTHCAGGVESGLDSLAT